MQWVFKYTETLILTCTRRMESLQLENQSLQSGVQSLQSIQNDEISENGKRRYFEAGEPTLGHSSSCLIITTLDLVHILGTYKLDQTD